MEQKPRRRRSENKKQQAILAASRRRFTLGDALLALVLIAATAIFSLFFFEHNTPLGASIGSDNAMYLTMGTMLADGAAPYTDVFDHKGPLLFLLQMLPQAIFGGYSTLGVFLMEALFTLGCLLALFFIGKKLRLNPAATTAMQLAYLALLSPILIGGNYCEEYTNLFTLVGAGLMLCTFRDPEQLSGPHRGKLTLCAMGAGAMAMLCFLTRANNVLPLMAMTLALAFCLLASGRISDLLTCALGFALGMGVAAAPIVLWLHAHGALSEAVYASITHNLMYAETEGASRVATLLHTPYGWYALFMAALACLGAFAYRPQLRSARIWKRRSPLFLRMAFPTAMVAGAAGAGLAAFISHKFYEHYLILGAPLAVIGVGVCLSLLFRKLNALRRPLLQQIAHAAVCLALSAAFVFTVVFSGSEAIVRRKTDRAAFETLQAQTEVLMAHVPQSDRDRLMAYRVEPKWYVAADVLPCMRFYFLQEILAQADPAVMDEIVATFEAEPPLWLVLFYNRPFSPPYDARVADIFETRYTFVDAIGDYQLLRLNDSADPEAHP